MRNIHLNGYEKPYPIQQQAIPVALNFRDMIGLAPTGSGKSVAFLLPLIAFLEKQPVL
jgi:ATP-dependent RNA helicase DDX23/PRP28